MKVTNKQIGRNFELLKHSIENFLEGQNGRMRDQDLDLDCKVGIIFPTHIQAVVHTHTRILLKTIHEKN